MSVLDKHNVAIGGSAGQAIVFAHGYGCDQHMWRMVAPAFERDYRTVLFDHVGCGAAELRHYDPQRYNSLEQYASDVLALCDALELERPVFVGHSVSAIIGLLAAARRPQRFASLVLVAPSPCYINDVDYNGGFEPEAIDELIELLDDNFVAWAKALAPTIMGHPARPELGAELETSLCRADPGAARQFARVTFLSDHRADLARVATPSLILQCSDDALAPQSVGRFMHAALAHSTFELLDTNGHCPHLSAPAATIAAMRRYLGVRA